MGGNLATEIARADLKITVAEFWAVTVIAMIGVGTERKANPSSILYAHGEVKAEHLGTPLERPFGRRFRAMGITPIHTRIQLGVQPRIGTNQPANRN